MKIYRCELLGTDEVEYAATKAHAIAFAKSYSAEQAEATGDPLAGAVMVTECKLRAGRVNTVLLCTVLSSQAVSSWADQTWLGTWYNGRKARKSKAGGAE